MPRKVGGSTGRVNQKARTRSAIVEAARSLIRDGGEVRMRGVAEAARVSEATAYRYFPDLPSLLREAVGRMWPDPACALGAVAESSDAVERVEHATEVILRAVLDHEGAVRAMTSAAVVSPTSGALELIDYALMPLKEKLASTAPELLADLRRELAITLSSEALFIRTDLFGLSPDEAVNSAMRTARVLTEEFCSSH